ncbi:MAG: hypothetical protein RLZZ597_3784 [Cyanobacteriota bacterium]
MVRRWLSPSTISCTPKLYPKQTMDRLFPPSSRSRLALPVIRRTLMALVLVLLCGGLWGCGWFNPAPPRSVVAEAVAQKVAQTQVALQQQLVGLTDTEARVFPQASGIHVTGHHWTTLNHQPTLEISGTYHLKGGGLGWGQQRQTRPFSLYLRRAGEDQWVVVNPLE